MEEKIGKYHQKKSAMGGMIRLKEKKSLLNQRGFRLFLMASPLLVLVLVFSYLPLYGWIFAFFNYQPGRKLLSCEFLGLKNFTSMFGNAYSRANVLRVLKNTFGISLLGMAISPLPLLFAVFLNEIKCGWFKKTVQTFTTIPNFISWVLVYAVAYALFSVNDGLVNRILVTLGITSEGINFLASPNHVWLSMTAWGLWKTLGWNAIMYIAAIAGIDQEQYESAKVDGASRWQMIRYITIPNLMPTYFILLMLSVANLMNNGMEQYFVFQNAMNKNSIEVLDLFVYNQGMVGYNFSFSTAVSMLKSIISIVLLFLVNLFSKVSRGETIV